MRLWYLHFQILKEILFQQNFFFLEVPKSRDGSSCSRFDDNDNLTEQRFYQQTTNIFPERMSSIGVIIDYREHQLWNMMHDNIDDDAEASNGTKFPIQSLLRGRINSSSSSSTPSRSGSSESSSLKMSIREILPYVRKQSLPVGDVWIVEINGYDNICESKKEDRILMIWERKTIDDLWCSIRDGRYHEQHDRVNTFAMSLGYDTKYLRVIEGLCPSGSSSSNRLSCIPPDTFFHICTKTYPESGNRPYVQTVRTYNLRETMSLLFSIWKDLQRSNLKSSLVLESPDAQIVDDNGLHLWKSLTHAKKIPTRKDHVTPVFVLSCALALVPRLSFMNAEKIAKAFGSLSVFITEHDRDPVAWKNTIEEALQKTSTLLISRVKCLFFGTAAPEEDDEKSKKDSK